MRHIINKHTNKLLILYIHTNTRLIKMNYSLKSHVIAFNFR